LLSKGAAEKKGGQKLNSYQGEQESILRIARCLWCIYIE